MPQPAPLVVEDLRAQRAREIADNVSKTRAERVEALRRVLEPRLKRSSEGLQREVLADGKHGLRLEGRFGHAAVARKRADGSLEYSCFADVDGATRFLTERSGQ